MSSSPKRKFSAQEYLESECQSETRSEFYRGEIFAMTGATREHNIICQNVSSEIYQQFKNRPCEVYSNDMRVKVESTGLYTYPDIVATCESPEFESGEFDNLLNPQVIIKALSKSTEAYDRGDKAAHFKEIKSLQAYFLISQIRPHIECFTRQRDGQWLNSDITDINNSLTIKCIDCSIPLDDIYARIDFKSSDERVNENRSAEYSCSDPRPTFSR